MYKKNGFNPDQDTAMIIKESEKKKKRVAGLNQEYPVKNINHPPEVFSFSPKIKHMKPEPDSKKRIEA